jgi:hypothetical protein
VGVVVPTRILLDPPAVGNTRELEDALLAATRRALDVSRRTLPQGAQTVLTAPTFVWSGPGLGSVAADNRAQVEAGVTRTLAQAGVDAGVTTAATGGTATQAPLPAQPELAWMTSLDDVYACIKRFYPQPLPKGDTLHGIYARWAEDGKPYVFYIGTVVGQGSANPRTIINGFHVAWGEQQNGRWVPVGDGRTQSAYLTGGAWRFEALKQPLRKGSTTYAARVTPEGGGAPHHTVLSDEIRLQLLGKVIRFTVATESVGETIVIEEAAPVTPRDPPWWLWYLGRSLPAVAQEGIPQALWDWIGWLNLCPESIRTNPLVRAAVQDMVNGGAFEGFNPLFIDIYWMRFYKYFARRVAQRMLQISRTNMTEFLGSLHADWLKYESRIEKVITSLTPTAQSLWDIRHLAEIDPLLPQYRELLHTRLPGGVYSIEDIRAKYIEDRTRQLSLEHGTPDFASVEGLSARAEKALLATAEDEANLAALLDELSELEPILILLTLDRGAVVRKPEEAVLWAAERSPYTTLSEVQAQLQWMIEWTREAETELWNNLDDAYQLAYVQQQSDTELRAWFVEYPPAGRAVGRLVEGTGVLFWLGVGGAVLAVGLVFPPAGAALGATIGIGQAVYSMDRLAHLTRMNRVRLAQAGYRPLASDEEVEAALFQATLDVVFAFFDVAGVIGVLGKGGKAAAKPLGAAAADQVGEALGRSLEREVVGWRRFDLWPEDLDSAIRSRIGNELDRVDKGWMAGRAVAEHQQIVEAIGNSVKGRMVSRYEAELVDLQRRFSAELEKGLSVADIGKWLDDKFPRPKDFFERMAREEDALFEGAVSQYLRDPTPPALPPRARFVAEPTRAELEALATKLGPRADLLTPARLADLGASTELGYRELAEKLDVILRKTETPHRVLARIEDLVAGRADARRLLEALERAADPEAVIAKLTPNVVDARLLGGYDELLEAVGRGTRDGDSIARFVSDLDPQTGRRVLFREVRRADGTTFFERWHDTTKGWQPDEGVRGVRARAAPGPTVTMDRVRRFAAAKERVSQYRARLTTEAPDVLAAVDRVGGDVGAALLHDLSLMDGLTQTELRGVADFLDRGGDGRVLSEILGLGGLQSRSRSFNQKWIRSFLEKLSGYGAGDLRGLAVLFAERGFGPDTARAVLRISDNFGADARAVFGALDDLAPHSDGLAAVTRYLESIAQNRNKAAVAQLYAARRLLNEFPGQKLAFEVQIFEGTGESAVLIREVDVRVVTPVTRATILDVELKEISYAALLEKDQIRRQFSRDVVRAVAASRASGQVSLKSIRWLIREQELRGASKALEAGKEVTKYAKSGAEVKREIRDVLDRAFDPPANPNLVDPMSILSTTEREEARQYFRSHYGDLIQLF